MIEKAYTNAALRHLFDFEAKAVPLKEGGVKGLNLCDSHLRHNFGGIGSGEWGVGSGELITSPLPTPHSLLPTPYSLLLLPRKRPFAEARQTDLALHRLAVGRSGVIDDALNLAGGFEREFDLVAFDRSGHVEFAEQTFVPASQLLALLFEGEARIS